MGAWTFTARLRSTMSLNGKAQSFSQTLQIRFWLTIDKQLALERRRTRRDYIVAEDAGYFNEKVWPEVERRQELLKNRDDIDTVSLPDTIYTFCMTVIGNK